MRAGAPRNPGLEVRLPAGGDLPQTLDDLAGFGVDAHTLDVLRGLIAAGHREAEVIVAWLAWWFTQGRQYLDRRARMRVERAADPSLVARIKELMVTVPPYAIVD